MDSTSQPPRVASEPATISTRNWVVSIGISTALSVLAVLIGTYRFQVGPAAIVLFPIIWAVLLGSIISAQRLRPLSGATRAVGDLLISVGIVTFLARLGMDIGPSLPKMASIGPAIALQEVGHIFGTVIVALPVAVALGLGRVAIGAAWSIDRESFLAYAIEKFGIRSPEYRGVFSVWLLGTVFGALFISLLAGLLGGLGWFDPRALALGLGLGSSSMMLGGVGALSVLYPEQAAEITALAAISNLVTNIVGFYAGVWLALPLARRLYAFWTRVFRRPAAEVREARELLKHRDIITADAALSAAQDPAPGVVKDPTPPTSRKAMLAAYLATAAAGLVANLVSTDSISLRDLGGMLVLLVLTFIALTITRRFPAVPASVAVLALATIVTIPGFPGAELLGSLVKNLNVLIIGLPQIALIGMGLGRDLAAFKRLNWKVVVVALITYSSSFIIAALIAHFVLGL